MSPTKSTVLPAMFVKLSHFSGVIKEWDTALKAVACNVRSALQRGEDLLARVVHRPVPAADDGALGGVRISGNILRNIPRRSG